MEKMNVKLYKYNVDIDLQTQKLFIIRHLLLKCSTKPKHSINLFLKKNKQTEIGIKRVPSRIRKHQADKINQNVQILSSNKSNYWLACDFFTERWGRGQFVFFLGFSTTLKKDNNHGMIERYFTYIKTLKISPQINEISRSFDFKALLILNLIEQTIKASL